METATLEKKIARLPENLKLKAEGYIDALLAEAKNAAVSHPAEINNQRGYGSLKSKIWMSEDFNDTPRLCDRLVQPR
jgi:hypothetical protein